MPLLSPILDDRSYQQLRDELVRRIPVYTPEWTDFNASDPGVTLIELFAFLGENALFRFNQIPESTKLEFLKLLQIPLRPAAAARAIVSFTTKDPAGTLIERLTSIKAGKIPFETQGEVHAWPLGVLAVAKTASGPPSKQELQDFTERAMRAANVEPARAAYYVNQTVPTDPAAPGSLPVDFARSVDNRLWVAVLPTKETHKARLGKGILALGLLPDQEIQPGEEILACPGEEPTATTRDVVWEISTGRLDPVGRPKYRVLAIDSDTTAALTKQGVVRLQLPDDATTFGIYGPTNPQMSPDLAGTGEFPPQLDDEDLDGQVLFWLRAYRRDGAPPTGRVSWLGVNAAQVEQTTTANPEFLGTGTGEAEQVYRLVNRNVIEGTLAVDVQEAGQWKRWVAVRDFLASREDDRHYLLDPEAGEVRFGNGVRGRAPQIGERIRALSYRSGGRSDGNVAPRAISKIDGPGFGGVTVSNPMAATGGAAAETLVDALDRIPGEIRRRDRAVTIGDFRELAVATPGSGVGRAECLPLFHPSAPSEAAAGVVSVVVWPRRDAKHPSAPMPDRTLIQAVCRWLDARRLVTTELHVIPPAYRPVAVAVGLKVKPGYGTEAVRRWVELVLRQYLAPLPPYGPDGGGWPLGRRVHGPELEAAALQVEGVEYLEGLNLADLAGAGAWIPRTAPPTVALEKFEVPELREITIVEGPPLDAGLALVPPEPPGVPIPIPVLREQC